LQYGDAWLVQLLFPALHGWNAWMWEHRRAMAAPGVVISNLMSLGSDATTPPGQNTPHTLAAAR